MLTLQSWRPKAEGLDIGRRIRIDHDCGGGRTLTISRDAAGYRAHCFRCNESGRDKPPTESLEQRLETLRRVRLGDSTLQHAVGEVRLPQSVVHDTQAWPAAFRLWLARSGLGASDLVGLRPAYHKESDRLVLPVYEGGRLVFWQARSLTRQPKYMAPAVDKTGVLPRWGSAPSPTLTEDILSAYKVGLVGEGWALLGTQVSPRVKAELLRRNSEVLVWLDPDAAGQRGATKIIKQLRAVGLRCRNIVSEKDPKLHTRAEIRQYLCDNQTEKWDQRNEPGPDDA